MDYIIQELTKEPVLGKRSTIAQQYPQLWSMVNVFTKEWLTLDFEVPTISSNKTDFKAKVVKHIFLFRELT